MKRLLNTDLYTYLTPIILGIIEGITEFLPISSTGHLLLAEQWLPRQTDLFNIVIQSGAVTAVVLFYWKQIVSMIRDFQKPENKMYIVNLFVAFIVTAIGGFLAKRLGFKLPETMVPIAWATLIGGILLLYIERKLNHKTKSIKITLPVAVFIGLAQIIAAIFPGASRSGTTIITAMFCGIDRKKATEFSFLLGIPTMYAAGIFQTNHALKVAHITQIDWAELEIGTAVSGIVAFLSVKWLLGFLQKNSFEVFGWYRIILGILMLLFFS